MLGEESAGLWGSVGQLLVLREHTKATTFNNIHLHQDFQITAPRSEYLIFELNSSESATATMDAIKKVDRPHPAPQ